MKYYEPLVADTMAGYRLYNNCKQTGFNKIPDHYWSFPGDGAVSIHKALSVNLTWSPIDNLSVTSKGKWTADGHRMYVEC